MYTDAFRTVFIKQTTSSASLRPDEVYDTSVQAVPCYGLPITAEPF